MPLWSDLQALNQIAHGLCPRLVQRRRRGRPPEGLYFLIVSAQCDSPPEGFVLLAEREDDLRFRRGKARPSRFSWHDRTAPERAEGIERGDSACTFLAQSTATTRTSH